jgi:hypothetical protein
MKEPQTAADSSLRSSRTRLRRCGNSTETYSNGVRKVFYRDPDGNETGFGGAPFE